MNLKPAILAGLLAAPLIAPAAAYDLDKPTYDQTPTQPIWSKPAPPAQAEPVSWNDYIPQELPSPGAYTCSGAFEVMKVARATMTAESSELDHKPAVDPGDIVGRFHDSPDAEAKPDVPAHDKSFVYAYYKIVAVFGYLDKGGCFTAEAAETNKYLADQQNKRESDALGASAQPASHRWRLLQSADVLIDTAEKSMKPSWLSALRGLF
jgi:hypothetical protein